MPVPKLCTDDWGAVVGGKRHGDTGYFVEPTVLVNTKPGMKVMDEEIFGPVVCAQPFEEIEEVEAHANNTRIR
jgi:acyl-CoA reductase-like NAD-dependent aldehyde dehydrogenase